MKVFIFSWAACMGLLKSRVKYLHTNGSKKNFYSFSANSKFSGFLERKTYYSVYKGSKLVAI
jgi:hypothetical protein